MKDEELAERLNQQLNEQAKQVAADDVLQAVGQELEFLKAAQEPMSPVEVRLIALLSATVKVLMVTRSKISEVT